MDQWEEGLAWRLAVVWAEGLDSGWAGGYEWKEYVIHKLRNRQIVLKKKSILQHT